MSRDYFVKFEDETLEECLDAYTILNGEPEGHDTVTGAVTQAKYMGVKVGDNFTVVGDDGKVYHEGII